MAIAMRIPNPNTLTGMLTTHAQQEAMRILGVSDKLHWLAHFLWQLTFLLVTSLIVAAVLKGAQVVENSTYGFTLLFFFMFGITVIMFCFAMSSFFSTASVATAFGTLLFFLFFVPFLFVMRPDIYGSLSRGTMFGMCLLPQTCMGLGTRIWVNKEASGVGMSTENMHIKATGVCVCVCMCVCFMETNFLDFDACVCFECVQTRCRRAWLTRSNQSMLRHRLSCTDADVMTMSEIFGMLVLDCFILGFISTFLFGLPRSSRGSLPEVSWFVCLLPFAKQPLSVPMQAGT
jgi:hypothetical protein